MRRMIRHGPGRSFHNIREWRKMMITRRRQPMRGRDSMDWWTSPSQISNTIVVMIGFHLRIQSKPGGHTGESTWYRTGHVPTKLCPRRRLHMMHMRLLLLLLTSHHVTMTWMMLLNRSILIVLGTLVNMLLLLFLHILLLMLLLPLAIIQWQGRRRPTPFHGRIVANLHLSHCWRKQGQNTRLLSTTTTPTTTPLLIR